MSSKDNKDNKKDHGLCGCFVCRKWIVQYVKNRSGGIAMLVLTPDWDTSLGKGMFK